MRKELLIGVGGLLVIAGIAMFLRPESPLPDIQIPQDTLEFGLPNGFTATLFSGEVPGARVMTRDPRGTILVSLTSEGKVVALPNQDSDSKADRVVAVLSGLNKPHGIVFIGDILYVAEEDAVRAYAYNADAMSAENGELIATLPTGGGHSTRSLLVSPDNTHLLVASGSSCNVCHEEDPKRAAVISIDLATKKTEVFAKGLRNTVFMVHHPVTGDIWGTDMGRDWLGDDLPPDEINIIKDPSTSLGVNNYGWPICFGQNIHDTDFDKNTYIRNPCMEPFETPSHIDIPAHSAPLGIAFVPEEGWPEEWWHDLLVAYHGSWNRSEPTGYKIVKFDLSPQGIPTGVVEDFMTGFTDSSGVIGRPVGLMIEPGGVLWVSDDKAGAIYRVSRTSIDE